MLLGQLPALGLKQKFQNLGAYFIRQIMQEFLTDKLVSLALNKDIFLFCKT